ncbi:flagellar export protein FliJ [Nocardioides sp. WS12]|uniref:flagellar FliJ family protein n=1 Tax=Nocardioides sp. WS12 TaxID=2486272 RepID=UPI0015FBE75A|nr:flagellar export protein FliJ [Nocardioides sp. WS12]
MSTRRPHPEDRGLAAVARVRSVRETDSRIGLTQVLAEEAAMTARLTTLQNQLTAAPVVDLTTPGELIAHRTALTHLGSLIQETRADVATAAMVSAEARARWISDRARLAAVEHLLEQRAAGRRTEARRKADREADDLAAQRWSRAHGGVA